MSKPTRSKGLPKWAPTRGRGRAGRALERTIALLREILTPDAEVQSPGWLLDIHTGDKREIDVLLTSTLPSGKVFKVQIECRDHKNGVGIGYVEEVATKRASVGSDLAIIVSATTFSANAITKAKALGIELVTTEPVSLDALRSWFDRPRFTQFLPMVRQINPTLNFDGDDPVGEIDATFVGGRLDTTAPLFWSKNGTRWSMLRVLCRHLMINPDALKDGPRDGSEFERTMTIVPSKPALYVRFRDGSQRRVTTIPTRATFSFGSRNVEVSAVRVTELDGETDAATARMMTCDENGEFSVAVDVVVARDKDGTVQARSTARDGAITVVRRDR